MPARPSLLSAHDVHACLIALEAGIMVGVERDGMVGRLHDVAVELDERVVLILEVIRAHRRGRVAAYVGGVLRQLDRILGRGGAGHDYNGRAGLCGLLDDFRHALAFLDAHKRAAAVGAADKQPVHLVGQVLHQLLQRLFVQIARLVERRDHGRNNAPQFFHHIDPVPF